MVDRDPTDQAGERTAFLMSAEIVDVLVGVVAGVVSGSELCASPSSRRRFCDEVARQLQRRIAAFQDHAAEHGTPFRHATSNYQLLCKECSDAKTLADKGQSAKPYRGGVDASGRPTDPNHP